ncbi:AraC family transcriptional regulator [Flavivirga sp. 57AJ16]|uniref:helix-turn-helix domain-containing protein n=1 Tax=Flavivirga sp. 57AJ16 TaxID=3025307 RepID=UPI002365ED3E|nr:AraC family transcriptional regulator [Flavivirga sp. 57AJ16]MDD7885432.1 AraC family transcriptional regulator [Flavivirga sp. 57AJ16]
MYNIYIENTDTKDVFIKLQQSLNGELKDIPGEHTLTFSNKYGKGTIRGIDFNWGVSLIDFDVILTEITKITFENKKNKLVEFIFISDGNLEFKEENTSDFINLDRYQNIILSNRVPSKKTFVFPSSIKVKVNIIRLDPSKYAKKKHSNLHYLDDVLRHVFDYQNKEESYQHIGNYNLKIADQIKQLNNTYDSSGIIRSLSIEGRLNLIMAMQILEHQNALNNKILTDSLSRSHIKKIQELSTYILNNISEPLPVTHLSKLSGIGQKKLQIGFKLLYSKSVNAYIRDLKLELSRDQLKNSDLTVSEIVYSVGFKSRSYFSKIFFKRYGILPKEYRASLKN